MPRDHIITEEYRWAYEAGRQARRELETIAEQLEKEAPEEYYTFIVPDGVEIDAPCGKLVAGDVLIAAPRDERPLSLWRGYENGDAAAMAAVLLQLGRCTQGLSAAEVLNRCGIAPRLKLLS